MLSTDANLVNIMRRKGQFRVPRSLILGNPELAYKIFDRVIVLRAEHMAMSDEFEYQALSERFREVGRAECAPQYSVEVKELPGGEKEVSFI